MAKKRSARNGKSNADHIRDQFTKNPKARNKDVVAALKEAGVSVSPNYVSIVKNSGKKKRGKGKRRGRKPGSVVNAMSNGLGIKQIGAAASFIRTAGGIAEARKALAAAEQLAKIFGG